MKKDLDIPGVIEDLARQRSFEDSQRESVSSADSESRNSDLNSNGFPEAYRKLLERVIPTVDVRDPSTWAVYGSAEKYYDSAFSYITNSYPYDGSALEKINWSLSASAIDLAVLQHEYPKTTGYVNIAASGWGASSTISGRYGLSSSPQYIKFSGGPYIGSVFDSSTQRGSNLKLDPTRGNTVEFWMKKDAFVSDSKTQTEVIFDSHTIDFVEGTDSYGRFLIELSGSSGSPLYVTYMSGTVGADRVQLGSAITAASVADGAFHHYAITAHHTGSSLLLELYVDGAYNTTQTIAAASFGGVLGYFNGSIGAMRSQKNSTGGLGYGQFSGSIDNFRFWKTKRTAEQIGNYYDFPVNGATDDETVESVLGLSYKFNEGILGVPSQDKVILDYSGRLNNGEFIGYTPANRSSSSAITEATVTNQSEVGDPIINPKSNLVVSKLSELVEIGKAYDKRNNNSIFKTVPQWAYETNEGSSNLDSNFSILLQTIAEKFDSIRMMIDGIPRVGYSQYKDFIYSKGEINHAENFSTMLGCTKDFDISYGLLQSEENFSIQNLISRNFSIEESPITDKSDLNEFFYNLKFDLIDKNNGLSNHFIHSKAESVKNRILNAIHINLPKIYKTKGTFESFRNLIRCFGVDEKLVIPNIYGQNVEKQIKDEPIYEANGTNLLSFTGSNRNVTLFQTASTTEERNYIEGKSTPAAFTLECKTYMPALTRGDSLELTTSIFGVNSVAGSTLELSSPNNSGLVVTAIKSKKSNNGAYFNLSSSTGAFTDITTPYYREVFANTPWFLSVRFSENTDSSFYNSNNKLAADKDYKVEFIGYQYDLDVKLSSFHLSSSITAANFEKFLTDNKSVFLGANRQNITGSLIHSSDCKIISFSYWDDYISDLELELHAQNVDNIGRLKPLQNRKANQGDNVDSSDSLVFHWQFEETTNVDANTTTIFDHSSGSLENISRYGLVGYKYPASTFALQNQNTIVQVEFPSSTRYIPIDNLYSRSKVEIKDREVEVFGLESRPITYLYTYEKSMYQAISREMLNMIAGVSAYNEIIGEPVYKYRQEYKSLEKLREKFFSKVENDISLERFIEYYKWIDSSLGKLLEQLQPATAAMHVGLEDTVESHTFERSKYKHQAPQLEYKDPKINGQILGVNELLYDWEHGHAPLSNSESDNCLWWKDRADRENDHKVSANLDPKREEIRRIAVADVSGSTYALRRLSRPYRFAGSNVKVIEQGSNRNANKNKELYKLVNTGKDIVVSKSDIYEFKVCDDVLSPQAEKIYTAKTNVTETVSYLDADSDMLLPFSMYSSSAPSPGTSIFKDKLKITNNHDDNNPTMQGVFSFENAGGMPHRRVKYGTPDLDRAEAYKITISADQLKIESTSSAPSQYERGIKSPYVFQNIKSTTGSAPHIIGNYLQDYDIVLTSGRSSNNRYLAETSSFSILPVSAGYIFGLPDYTTPVRPRNEHVIVNTFSSPGGPETQAAFARDKESGEFSIYNTLNYRNLSVREPLNILYAEKSEKFGYRSGSSTQASIHMTNRNNFYVTGTYSQKTKQDSFFIQHPIPQNDFSYSWITASAVNSRFDFVSLNDGFGHQHLFSSSSAKSIQFLTSSEENINLPFMYINTGSIEHTLLSNDNLLSASNYNSLNDLVLNRQGPYGWPSWKQLRGSQHPISRLHKKTNVFSRVYLGSPLQGTSSIETETVIPNMNIGASIAGSTLDVYERANESAISGAISKSRIVKNYVEPPVTAKFSPIRMIIHADQTPDGQNRSQEFAPGHDFRLPQYFTTSSLENQLLHQSDRESNWYTTNRYYRNNRIDNNFIFISSETLQNDFVTFSNKNLLRDLGGTLDREHTFFSFADNMFSAIKSANERQVRVQGLEDNNTDINRQVELCYTEVIYPREQNMFLEQTRERTKFDYYPWKSDRSSRSRLLSGNVNYSTKYLTDTSQLAAFPKSVSFVDANDKRLTFYEKYDTINIGLRVAVTHEGAERFLQSYRHITASKWPIDAREDFSALPVSIHNSYFNEGPRYLFSIGTKGTISTTQGSSGEGILQNDFSTFPLGYNNLYGTPPFSTVYNRRIPQTASAGVFLSGEAKWEAADNILGPFYDSYEEYYKEIKHISRDHSLVPEFRISEFTEQILSGDRKFPGIGSDFLIMTGTASDQSSADVSVGGQFFKSYSNTEFLKYFSVYDEEVVGPQEDPKNNVQHARINFKCQAAMKFLPYEGFYPAERATEITRLFNKHYLGDDIVDAARIGRVPSQLEATEVYRFARLRANACRYQVSKPLFGPGVLFNSIKSGLAVDYPIFFTDFSPAVTQLQVSSSEGFRLSGGAGYGKAIRSYESLNMSPTVGFTGSAINNTDNGDFGIPRIKSYTTSRIEFEDMLNPVNLYETEIHDNEPHPSASLLYGNDEWNKIIERPTSFGQMNNVDLSQRLGLRLNNTKEALSKQLLPYTLAMQNFAAETVNFFVEDGHLTTVMSKPVNENFVSGTTYKMKARITNVDTTMYDRHSAFGPPVDDSGDGVTITNYTATPEATPATVEFTFTDWPAETTSKISQIVAEDSSNVLPKISWNAEGVAGQITFFDGSSISPSGLSNTSKQGFVDLNTFSTDDGKNLATAFSSSLESMIGAIGYDFSVTKTNATVKVSFIASGVTGSSTHFTFGTWKRSGVTYNTQGSLVSSSVTPTVPFSDGRNPPTSLWTASTSVSKAEHGFSPYVPPYLDPNADPYVEISFTPDETKKYEAKEIIENSVFEYYNFHEDPTNKDTNTNYVHSMALSASLNLGLCASLRTDNVETIEEPKERGKARNRFDVDQNKKLSRWVIQTKWETPVLDFSFATASALDLTTGQVTQTSGSPWKEKYWDSYYERGRANASATIGDFLTASTGMWHQRGDVIDSNSQKGYFLRIEDVPLANGQPGLAGKLGFNLDEEQSTAVLKKAKNYRSRIGSVENRKIVKEAIVAIPYVIREDEDNRLEFIKFNEQYYTQASRNIQLVKQELATKPLSDSEEIQSIRDYQRFIKTTDRKIKEPQSDCPVDAIEYQLLMMEDYILPPELDFLNTSREFQLEHNLDPFIMYFFQFHASFDKQDLSNIWQNLYPVTANSAASPRYSQANKRLPGRMRVHGDVSYVSHYLETMDVSGLNLSPVDSPRDLFSPSGGMNKTRWLVFKVKQRGKANLEEIRKASIDPRVSNIEKLEYVKNSKPSFTEDTLPRGTAGLEQDGTMNVQFNWPYDYFSFVELIKLETKIDSFNYQKQ